MVMASALCPPRGPKLKGAPPSHYYENFLEKKGPCDQDYRKFWAGLQGLAICFYNSNRDLQPLEKLDLRLFSKLKDEALLGSSHDTTYHFSLVLRDQEVKFKVESLESCEMWKGFILTVVELRVPSNLTLLPGHMYMMAEVLAKEEVRRAAEVPWSPVIKHYKVKREGSKYVIDVEDPFSCPSLEAVVNYFVTHTKRALVPFLLDEDYEKVLGFVDSDRENGENAWTVPSSRGSGPALPANVPKPLPPVPVSVSSQEDKLPQLPPLPQLPDQDENYVTPIEDSLATEYMNRDDLKAITNIWTRKLGGSSPQASSLVTRLGDITAELEEKLQKRRALEH
ncbi:signal-transducing adaptor protein 2 isoform X6 [Rattus norvegicus]